MFAWCRVKGASASRWAFSATTWARSAWNAPRRACPVLAIFRSATSLLCKMARCTDNRSEAPSTIWHRLSQRGADSRSKPPVSPRSHRPVGAQKHRLCEVKPSSTQSKMSRSSRTPQRGVDGARHAVDTGEPPKNPMSLEEAEGFVRRQLANWFDEMGS